METIKQQAAVKIGRSINFRGIEFLTSMDTIAKKTRDAYKENQKLNKKIAKNLSSAVANDKKLAVVDERIEDILERQRNFLDRTEKKSAPVPIVGAVLNRVLEKPVAALQKLLLGILVANAPRIISTIKETLNRLKLIKEMVGKMLDTGKNFAENALGVVNALIENLKSFDLTDKSKRIQGAINQFEKDFASDREEIDNIARMWELGGDELEQAIRRLEGFDPETGEQTTPGGSPGSGAVNIAQGTPEEYRIAAAIATEAGRGQSAVDVLQVAANRVASSDYPNNFTDVFAQPKQFQGVFDRGIEQYRQIQTAEDAASFAGTSANEINGYVTDLRNVDLRSQAAQDIGGALEFRAAPQYYQERPSERPAGTGSDGRIPGSSWRGGRGDNQILTSPERGDPMLQGGAAPINYGQGGVAAPRGNTSSQLLASSAEALLNQRQDTSRYGRNGCVYAVNLIYQRAGLTPPWGSSVYVPDARAALLRAGYTQVSMSDASPGDIVIFVDGKEPPWFHIGIVSSKGTVIHNSSTNQALTQNESFSSILTWTKRVEVFRMPASSRLVGKVNNELIKSTAAETEAALVAKVGDFTAANKEGRMAALANLDYDYEGAEERELQKSVVLMKQPILATQTVVVKEKMNEGGSGMGQMIAFGGGGNNYTNQLLTSLM